MQVKDEGKIKLSEVRQIALLAASIPPNKKAMGFRVDSKLISLSEDQKAQIEYHIGDELKEIREKSSEIIQQIRKPLYDEFKIESEGLSDEDKKPLEDKLTVKINSLIQNNEELKDLNDQEIKLWETEIEPDINTIEIEEKDYESRFIEPRKFVFMDREFTMDGYDALLLLIAKDVVKILPSANTEAKPELTPSAEIQKEIEQLTND